MSKTTKPKSELISVARQDDFTLVRVSTFSGWLKKFNNEHICHEQLPFIYGAILSVDGIRVKVYTDVFSEPFDDEEEHYHAQDLLFSIPFYVTESLVFHGFIYADKGVPRFKAEVLAVYFQDFDDDDDMFGEFQLDPDKHLTPPKN